MWSLKQRGSLIAEQVHATPLWVLAVVVSVSTGCASTEGTRPQSNDAAAVSGSGAAGVAPRAGAVSAAAGAGGALGPAPVAPAAGSAGATPTNGTPMAAPGSPAWSAIFRDIIVAKGCQGASLCHGGQAGKLMMTTRKAAYDNLVGKAAMGLSAEKASCADSGLMRVVPGDPDNSLFMQKVRGTHTCGDLMPPNPPMLSPTELAQIQMWIMLGAAND